MTRSSISPKLAVLTELESKPGTPCIFWFTQETASRKNMPGRAGSESSCEEHNKAALLAWVGETLKLGLLELSDCVRTTFYKRPITSRDRVTAASATQLELTMQYLFALLTRKWPTPSGVLHSRTFRVPVFAKATPRTILDMNFSNFPKSIVAASLGDEHRFKTVSTLTNSTLPLRNQLDAAWLEYSLVFMQGNREW